MDIIGLLPTIIFCHPSVLLLDFNLLFSNFFFFFSYITHSIKSLKVLADQTNISYGHDLQVNTKIPLIKTYLDYHEHLFFNEPNQFIHFQVLCLPTNNI